MKSVGFYMRFPKIVCKTILQMQMVEILAVYFKNLKMGSDT